MPKRIYDWWVPTNWPNIFQPHSLLRFFILIVVEHIIKAQKFNGSLKQRHLRLQSLPQLFVNRAEDWKLNLSEQLSPWNEDEKVELMCIGDRSGLDTEKTVQSILGQITFILGPFYGMQRIKRPRFFSLIFDVKNSNSTINISSYHTPWQVWMNKRRK